MIEISKKLYIGNMQDLQGISYDDYAVVHATQTIHYEIMGWNRTTNKPDKNNPNYILWKNNNRLSLNWVDGDAYLFNWSGAKTFIMVLNFIDDWVNKRKVLIHCDQGLSRSPTLGLLYLAKRLKIITEDSFSAALSDFVKIYPIYQPKGIADFVNQHWIEII
jgi:hypothetical protein